MLVEHWSYVTDWPYKYFTPKELASRGDGSLLIDHDAIGKLEHLRELAGVPLIINSAYRDPHYNARINGAPLSMHKFGRAFDISLKTISKPKLIVLAKEVGFTGLGVNYNSFVHVDTGRKRQW